MYFVYRYRDTFVYIYIRIYIYIHIYTGCTVWGLTEAWPFKGR